MKDGEQFERTPDPVSLFFSKCIFASFLIKNRIFCLSERETVCTYITKETLENVS